MPQGSTEISRIDSEIALTAFLATAVSVHQVPTFRYTQIITLIGVLLLFITLVRRIALFEGIQNDSKLMTVSNVILYSSTTICITYLIYGVSVVASNHFIPTDWATFVFAHLTLLFGLLSVTVTPSIIINELRTTFGNIVNIDLGGATHELSKRAEKETSEADPRNLRVFDSMRHTMKLVLGSAAVTGIIHFFFGYDLYYLSLFLGITIIYGGSLIWYSRYGVVRYEEILEHRMARRVNIVSMGAVSIGTLLFII